jgi:hypothetical protein
MFIFFMINLFWWIIFIFYIENGGNTYVFQLFILPLNFLFFCMMVLNINSSLLIDRAFLLEEKRLEFIIWVLLFRLYFWIFFILIIQITVQEPYAQKIWNLVKWSFFLVEFIFVDRIILETALLLEFWFTFPKFEWVKLVVKFRG